MRKNLLIAIGSSLLLVTATLSVRAWAADKGTTSAGGKVTCSGFIPDAKVADFIEGQLAAGRTNIAMTGASAVLVCAW